MDDRAAATVSIHRESGGLTLDTETTYWQPFHFQCARTLLHPYTVAFARGARADLNVRVGLRAEKHPLNLTRLVPAEGCDRDSC